jgi:ubiquinone/menaquinone biosynthesis C-methylase UbiE
MASKIAYRFGKYQPYVSDKMRHRPGLAKLVAATFGYTNIGTWGRQLIFKKILKLLPMDKMTAIMDLGCGQGEFAFMLADALPNAQIDAADTDVAAMKKIEEVVKKFDIKNLHTYTCMIQELGPEKDEYYDMIFSIDVFQHIPEQEMPFQACRQRLKKGGYLVTKMPAKDHQRILPKKWFKEFDDTLAGKNPEQTYMAHHGQVYSLEDLVKRYEAEGFKVVAAFYSDGIIARAGWELNYLMMKGGTITHLLSLPIAKTIMWFDSLLPKKKRGNVIQVIGQKV